MKKEEINVFKSHEIWRLIVDAIESDTQIMTAKLIKASSIDDVRKCQGAIEQLGAFKLIVDRVTHECNINK